MHAPTRGDSDSTSSASADTLPANVINLPPTTWYVSIRPEASTHNPSPPSESDPDDEARAAPEAAPSSKRAQPTLIAAPNGTVIGVYKTRPPPACMSVAKSSPDDSEVLACRYLAMPKTNHPSDCERTLSDEDLAAVVSHCERKLDRDALPSASRQASSASSSEARNCCHCFGGRGAVGEVRMLTVSDVATSPSLARLRPAAGSKKSR